MHKHTVTQGRISLYAVAFLLSFLTFLRLNAQSTTNVHDEKLLDNYIDSDGFNQKIVFDSKNIKQYWVDHSVFSKDDLVHILLMPGTARPYESIPLRIQLSNVTETLDCKIYVVTDNADFSFSVLDDKKKDVIVSKDNNHFLNYCVSSALIHLESFSDYSFYLRFKSNSIDTLDIHKIVLAFSKNLHSSFLVSPGNLSFSPDNCTVIGSSVSGLSASGWNVTGKQVSITSNNKIYLYDNILSSSVKLKNTGTVPARVYLGYIPYSKDKTKLDGKNYPFRNNGNLTVVSAKPEGNKIIIDSFPAQWAKTNYLALNAKEDFSDLPSFSFVPGTIVDVKQIENGHAEITISEKLESELEAGSEIRIHGKKGTSLYTNILELSPGEEKEITSSLKLDNDCIHLSQIAFPRGTYYVVPFLRFSPIDSDGDSSIMINEFHISY